MRDIKFHKTAKGILKLDKIIPVIFTIFLSALIVSSGPVSAAIVTITAPSSAKAATTVTFPVTISFNPGESVTKITFDITGPSKGKGHTVNCVVTTSGGTSCIDESGRATSELIITQTVNSCFGYCPSGLSYSLEWHTPVTPTPYTIVVKVFNGNNIIGQQTQTIQLTAPPAKK